MDRVPFERVERIKRALTDDLLPGLVAVLSKANCDDLLLVYVRNPPPVGAPLLTAITLDEFATADIGGYNGPILGLASIDLVRWAIPTKGVGFARLDRHLRRRNLAGIMHNNLAELAEYLSEKIDSITAANPDGAFRQRVLAEIAAIAAPRKIAGLPAERRRGLVAFVPARDEVIYLDEGSPLDAIGALPGGGDDKVIALDEVRPLLEAAYPPALRNQYPIELRDVLRRAHLNVELSATLHTLAVAFHQRWERKGYTPDRRRAYALALERHLADGDVDDLIAVLPDPDFETFLRHGNGTYVYRCPAERNAITAPEGRRLISLDDAAVEVGTDLCLPAVFSLLPLRDLLCPTEAATQCWSDLGPVLRNVGRTEILARNAWLLVLDFLEMSRDQRSRFRVQPRRLLQTMTRCCAIFSLTDPWRTRLGRRNEWLWDAYESLHRVLQMLVQTSDGLARSYYQALGYWYGCALDDGRGVLAALESMVAILDARDTNPHLDGTDPQLIERADQLTRFGKALIDMLRGGGRAEAYVEMFQLEPASIPQIIRQATDMAAPMQLVAEPFWGSFRQHATIVDNIRRTKASQIPVRDKIDQLDQYATQLQDGRRLIFAPQHQVRMLACLYDAAIDETQALVQRLRGGASLEVELRTRSIAPDSDGGGIVFSVTNVGSVEARDVEIELFISDAFELLDQSFKQTLPRLGPEDEHSFRFSIRSVTGAEAFPVRCAVSYSDSGRERDQRDLEFTMRVTGLDSGPFHQKPNPYVFGLPLQEHRQFYGRRGELEKLLSHLADRRPQNVLLRGARRTGKTSLLYMVRAVLTDVDGRAGVRDWFELPPTWYRALDSTVPVILNLQVIDWRDNEPTPTGFYQAILAALAEAGLRSALGDRLMTEPSVTGTQLVNALTEILKDAGGVRPVVLVDEFDILDQIAAKSYFYGALRHVISTVQGVTWVVASALGLYNEVRDYESPLFNVFKIIDLGLLEPDAARRLILSPWQPRQGDGAAQARSRLQFADDAVEAILDEAGCYPYFIQLLCSEIVEHANATRTGFVQHKTVFQVIERHLVTAGSAASEHFSYLWDRAGGVGKLILLTLLRHPGPMRPDELELTVLRRVPHRLLVQLGTAPRAYYDDSLQRLVVVDAVRRAPAGGYVFGIPLFRRMLLKRNDGDDLLDDAYQTLTNEHPMEVGRG